MLPLRSVYCSFGQIMRTLHNLNGTERVGKNSLIQQLQTVERLWYPSLSKDGSGYQSIRQSNNQYLGGIFYVVRPWHSCLLAKLHRRSVARVAFGAAQLPGSFGWATRRECLVAFARGTHFGTDSGGGGNFDFGWTVGNMGDLEAPKVWDSTAMIFYDFYDLSLINFQETLSTIHEPLCQWRSSFLLVSKWCEMRWHRLARMLAVLQSEGNETRLKGVLVVCKERDL